MIVKKRPILRSHFFVLFLSGLCVSVQEIKCPYDVRRRYYDQWWGTTSTTWVVLKDRNTGIEENKENTMCRGSWGLSWGQLLTLGCVPPVRGLDPFRWSILPQVSGDLGLWTAMLTSRESSHACGTKSIEFFSPRSISWVHKSKIPYFS